MPAPAPLPFPTEEQIAEALAKLRARVAEAGVATEPTVVEPQTEHENRWQSYIGVKYTLQRTDDGFRTWITLVNKRPGDGTIQSHVDTDIKPSTDYRLIQDIPEGTEAQFIPIVAWDGSYVLPEWKPIGKGAVCRIYRDNVLRATVPSHLTSFNDAPVLSGQRYTYSVQVWPT